MWAVVCKSGQVRQMLATLRVARARANDAAFECTCRERGHRVVREETGREYRSSRTSAGQDRRNAGKYRCSTCGRAGHVSRSCHGG